MIFFSIALGRDIIAFEKGKECWQCKWEVSITEFLLTISSQGQVLLTGTTRDVRSPFWLAVNFAFAPTHMSLQIIHFFLRKDVNISNKQNNYEFVSVFLYVWKFGCQLELNFK